jgi:hypothetical protein
MARLTLLKRTLVAPSTAGVAPWTKRSHHPLSFSFLSMPWRYRRLRHAIGVVVALQRAMVARNELNPMHLLEKDCLCGS